MKKLLMLCTFAVFGLSQASAQLDTDDYGFLNHVAVGVSAGTDGIGFQVAAPLTYHFAVRAAYNFMPKISYKKDVNVGNDVAFLAYPQDQHVDIKGDLKMGDFSVLFDIYPSKKSSFRFTAGAYFGQEKFVEVKNADPFLQPSAYGNKGIELGTGAQPYTMVSDEQGNVKADVKVKSFKPYLGIGFGRAVPKSRIGLQFDLGGQCWGKPEVWTTINDEWGVRTYQKVDKDRITNPDKDYQDVKDAVKTIEKFSVYPVMSLRLVGRLF